MNIKLDVFLKSIIGLFIPVKTEEGWRTTLSVANIPLGLIMIAVSVVVNLIMGIEI